MMREELRGDVSGAARLVASAGCLRRPLAALALAWLAAGAQAEPLGRLFFIPERRATLERQRQLNIQEKTQEVVEEIANVHLNGVVRRSGNKSTIWVNGRVQRLDDSAPGITLRPSVKEADKVSVSVGDERPTILRIGETLNRSTQETVDGLAGGQLQVHSGRATKPPPR